MRQVILDTETTGFDPDEGDRVIEIGCREIIDRRINDKGLFHRYISPQGKAVGDSFKIHGLSDAFLKDKSLFTDIVDEFLAWVGDSEIIAHNADFDISFLDNELRLAGSTYRFAENNKITDTLKIARDQFPGQRSNLDALCKRYNIDNSNRSLHGALIDADLLAKVYLNLTGGQFDLLGLEDSTEDSTTQQYRINPQFRIENLQHLLPSVSVEADHESAHQAYLQHLKVANDEIW